MSKFETGAENASRFVRAVERLAAEQRIICLSLAPRTGVVDRALGDWVWMQNPGWREEVLQLFKDRDSFIRFPTFHRPDHLDGWTFSAWSTAPAHKVQILSLQDSLTGSPPPRGVKAVPSRVAEYLPKLAPWLLVAGFVFGFIWWGVRA